MPEEAFVTEPPSTTESNRATNLKELKEQYRRLRKYSRLDAMSLTDSRNSFKRRLRDEAETEDPEEKEQTVIQRTPKTVKVSGPRMTIVKQDSYDLLSANEIQSPAGILMKSLTRTIRRMKHKEREGT